MKEICTLIAEYHKVPLVLMFSKSRKRKYVLPRQIAMYIIRNRPGMTLQKTADYFKVNHATVVHSIKTIIALSETYPDFKSDIDFIVGYTSSIYVDPSEIFCRSLMFPKKPVKV